MTNFEKVLDEILLSNNPDELFYKKINSDGNFFYALNKMFPEIKKCALEPQNSKWHIYNVLDHTLFSIKHINELSKDLPKEDQKVLAYTMFYHDLGKPEALKINMSGSNPLHSFSYHQEISADIVNRTIKNFSFSEEEQEKIYTLVKHHDYFMLSYKNIDKYINNEEYLSECIKDDINFFGEDEIGKEYLNNLVLIAKADNLSQNPEMTKESLEFLDSYEKLLNEIDCSQNNDQDVYQ